MINIVVLDVRGNINEVFVDESTVARIVTLAKGNPGAARVCIELFALDRRTLDAMEMSGMTGPKIWVAYKDICNESLPALFIMLMNLPKTLAHDVDALPPP